MGRWLTSLGVLLQPWAVLAPAVLALGLVQGFMAQATGAVLLQRLLADALMLMRALPLWCLLLWPALALSARLRAWMLAAMGSLLLFVLAVLDLYFSVAGVPLGADLLAYSWQEIRTTVAGAQLSLPWPMLAVLSAALAALCMGVLRPQSGLMWRWPAAAPAGVHAGALGLCAIASLALPVHWPKADADGAHQAANKLVYFVEDLLSKALAPGGQAALAFPFEHAETTPDTLGPLLALDARTPPHLVLVLVEGLGRSFSGPGARLGSFTPFLDTLAGRSLYWENFLATQGRTFAVLPSVLASLPFGPYGAQPMVFDSLPGLIKAQGYGVRYFSGTNLEFDHQGAFMQASGVERLWSERDYNAPAHKLSEWGYSDGDLLQAVQAQPWPSTPSLTVVQTMSMHTPFVVPRMEHWRLQVQARLKLLALSQAQREAVLRQQDIYASILYTDDALRGFFEHMAQQPGWKNTIVLITGDHRLPEIPMDTRIERYHVPLIVHSPMLRESRRIKALSSHFDIAPALLAMLSHRYGWATPQRVHWMGQGLDVQPQWRNLHTLPLKQIKNTLNDYVSGEYYLVQDRLMTLQDGLMTSFEENPVVMEALRSDFAQVLAALSRVARQGALVAEGSRSLRVAYDGTGRTLEPTHRARQIEGVVVKGAQGRFEGSGQLMVQGVFTQQGGRDSTVFVPLLVLSDDQGRELAEASGQAMRLGAGQSRTVPLQLSAHDLPAGTYYFSLIVSHPETGRSVGKGQYHVAVVR